MKYILPLLLLISCSSVQSQSIIYKNFDEKLWTAKLDSLKIKNGSKVTGTENLSELAVNIALTYYPELKNNKIKIKYKRNVRYPVTASWAIGNFFRFRKSHTYVLLLKPDSFLDYISLNKLVGVYGHEMAHFVYYKNKPAVNMVWWGIKYTFSKKFRLGFERDADKTAMDHQLGWQILDMSFYMSKNEIRTYIKMNYP